MDGIQVTNSRDVEAFFAVKNDTIGIEKHERLSRQINI